MPKYCSTHLHRRPQHGGRLRPVAGHRHERRISKSRSLRWSLSFTQFVPVSVHLKDLGELVCREIERAGGGE